MRFSKDPALHPTIQAVRGVSTLVHWASHGYVGGDSGDQIVEARVLVPLCRFKIAQGAYHETTNVVNAAIKGGVKKIIVTSSYASPFERECLVFN